MLKRNLGEHAFFLLLFVMVHSSSRKETTMYVGCMVKEGLEEVAAQDTTASNRELVGKSRGPFVYHADNHMTIKDCVIECWRQRYDFAALQGGQRCYCSTTTQGLIAVPNPFCYLRCNRNCRQHCGGHHALSVYRTGYIKEPDVSFPEKYLKLGLLGCFRRRSVKELCIADGAKTKAPDLDTERMTAQMCCQYCFAFPTGNSNGFQTYNVAVLKDKNSCCCGLFSNPLKFVEVTQQRMETKFCNVPCSGFHSPGCIGNEPLAFRDTLVTAYNKSALLVAGMTVVKHASFEMNPRWKYPPIPKSELFLVPDETLHFNSIYAGSRDESALNSKLPELTRSDPDKVDEPGVSDAGQGKKIAPVVESKRAIVNVADAPVQRSNWWAIVVVVFATLMMLLAIVLVSKSDKLKQRT